MAKKPLRVKHNHLERDRGLKLLFGALRFTLYGFVGLSAEVIFYTLVKVGRLIPVVRWLFVFDWRVDPRLNLSAIWDAPVTAFFGQCSLWMFPVYAGASMLCVEPLYRALARRPWALRALLYGLSILAFEAASGWALFWLTGYKIWFYDDRFNVVGMTSLAIGPIWMATGLLVERIYRELMDPKAVAELERLEAAAEPRGLSPS